MKPSRRTSPLMGAVKAMTFTSGFAALLITKESPLEASSVSFGACFSASERLAVFTLSFIDLRYLVYALQAKRAGRMPYIARPYATVSFSSSSFQQQQPFCHPMRYHMLETTMYVRCTHCG